MADFDAIWTASALNEGGLVDDPDDPGGITNRGLTLRFLIALGDENHDGHLDGDLDRDGDVDRDDIVRATDADARQIYFRHLFTRNRYDEIADHRIAAKAFDLSLPCGAPQANLMLQRACRSCGYPVTEDGILGAQSIATVNRIPPNELLCAFRSEAAGYFRLVAALRKTSGKYLNGWLNQRAYS